MYPVHYYFSIYHLLALPIPSYQHYIIIIIAKLKEGDRVTVTVTPVAIQKTLKLWNGNELHSKLPYCATGFLFLSSFLNDLLLKNTFNILCTQLNNCNDE